jgi:hypothetical protein
MMMMQNVRSHAPFRLHQFSQMPATPNGARGVIARAVIAGAVIR